MKKEVAENKKEYEELEDKKTWDSKKLIRCKWDDVEEEDIEEKLRANRQNVKRGEHIIQSTRHLKNFIYEP